MMFKNTMYQSMAMFYIALVSMVISFWLARNLGPSLFGEYQSLLAVFSIGMILVDSGFRTLLYRERVTMTPGFPIWQNIQAKAHGQLLVLFSVLACVIFIFQIDIIYFWALACYSLITLGQWRTSVLRGGGGFLHDASWQALQRTLSACGILVLVYFSEGSDALIRNIFIGWISGLVLSWLIFRIKYSFGINFSISPVLYKSMFILVMVDLAATVYLRADIIILKWLNAPLSDVGMYAAAYKFIEATNLLVTPFAAVWFARIRSKYNNKNMFNDLMRTVVIMLLVGGIMALGIRVFSNNLIAFLYGDDYLTSASILNILTICIGFIPAVMLLFQAVLAMNYERSLLILVLLIAIFNLVINTYTIPEYGVYAAAWTAVATIVFLFIGLFYLSFRLRVLSRS